MKLELKIRRLVVQVDEIHHEMSQKFNPPARKALAAAPHHPFQPEIERELHLARSAR